MVPRSNNEYFFQLVRKARAIAQRNWKYLYLVFVMTFVTLYIRSSRQMDQDWNVLAGQGIAVARDGEIEDTLQLPLDLVEQGSSYQKSEFKPLFTKKRLVLWSSDFYTSPVYDLKHLLRGLGVTFIDQSLSHTCQRTDTCAKDLKVLNRQNAMALTPSIISQFYRVYKDDPMIKSVDAFVCFYPVSMCRVFVPFNKSIIMIASHRYELGMLDMWEDWNKELIQIAQDPKNVIAANNKYDVEYIKYFTGLEPVLLPNYCGYIAIKYRPVRPGFLLSAGRDRRLWTSFTGQFDHACKMLNCSVDLYLLRRHYPSYSYQDLASHQGIVHVPYQVSAMSLFEQYRMNIPLFFPSVELLAQWQYKYMVMPERTLSGAEGYRSAYSKIRPHPSQSALPNPNNDRELEAIKYWLKFSDFYQFPYIIHYNSFEDLVHKLETTNLRHVSLRMEWHNEVFREELMAKWRHILSTVASHSDNTPK